MVAVKKITNPIESAIYKGNVSHQRFVPVQHNFDYNMYFFWLKLSELNESFTQIKHFAVNKLSPYQFRTADYFPSHRPTSVAQVEQIAKSKMGDLGASSLTGNIYFMGQIRALGMFFSPVNFYFHKQADSNRFNWMLAEVSNTPWNQRHYYLVDMTRQLDSEKQFHVSPFNPIDMQYQWQIAQPDNNFNLALTCHKAERHFTASLNLQKQPLTSSTMGALLLRMPSTTLYSLLGIYWQALRLFVKRAPIYSHPSSSSNLTKDNNNESK